MKNIDYKKATDEIRNNLHLFTYIKKGQFGKAKNLIEAGADFHKTSTEIIKMVVLRHNTKNSPRQTQMINDFLGYLIDKGAVENTVECLKELTLPDKQIRNFHPALADHLNYLKRKERQEKLDKLVKQFKND
jgi:hypothetical protein